jgi:hypothetical protein
MATCIGEGWGGRLKATLDPLFQTQIIRYSLHHAYCFVSVADNRDKTYWPKFIKSSMAQELLEYH